MTIYKGFRHERSKGDDGLRTNYWYLLRADGHEDLAVIGREIKGSGGHYNYNSAPLFGMQSWVNSSEVRKWLQSQIADPQTLRGAATAATSSGQDALYPSNISRHGSDSHIPQDAGPRSGTMSGGSDAPWGVGASLGNRSGGDSSLAMLPLTSPAPQLAPPHLPPCVGAHSGETGLIMDKHQRNAVLGHTLGLIEAQLDFLRKRAGVEYTMTLVTQERDVHVLGSSGVVWRSSERSASVHAASTLPPVQGSAPEAHSMEHQRQDGGAALAQQDHHSAALNQEASLPMTLGMEMSTPLGGSLESAPSLRAALGLGPGQHLEEPPPPAWQLQTKRALSDLWNLSELEDARKRVATTGITASLPPSMQQL